MPTAEKLSRKSVNKKLDLFETTCKILRLRKAIERIWTRQRLMHWFLAVMTAWVYERAKHHLTQISELYQSSQLDIGQGAYKRAFLTPRNAMTKAVKPVDMISCTT